MRETILVAARRIMAEDGIDALSMRAIARAIGYSPAALYEYFSAKEDVLNAIYFEGARGLSGQMVNAMEALPPDVETSDAMRALGLAYRDFALEHPDLYRLVFGKAGQGTSQSDDGKVDDTHGGFNLLVEVAARAVDRGEFVALPPPVIAAAAWSVVHGFVSLELSGHLSGGDAPTIPPSSPEEGRARRDDMFDVALRMTLYGFMNQGD
jgi:AcrR family transcriptional regulator